MRNRVDYDTITDVKHHYCGTCGWPVIYVCCNGQMSEQLPYCKEDWWAYCSNKCCINHSGSPEGQNRAYWIIIPAPRNKTNV